ncbi:MAG TPA: DUF4149 domain-containing protein [Acidobacteriaceae bacterium]|jgi:hypothetical protein|nr:DUF4149 domain-containing protein [Acidobacteriaceae bacterium]
MKTLIRTAVWLSLIIWLGGMFFFVVTAWASFSTVPDTHVAGTIVAKCLHVLHHEGLVAGCIILAFLAIGRARGVYLRGVKTAIAVLVIMMGLTAFSEYWIIPHMERDRMAVGGAIDSVPSSDPHHADFNRLHRVSEHMETAAMIGGLILVVILSLEHDRD